MISVTSEFSSMTYHLKLWAFLSLLCRLNTCAALGLSPSPSYCSWVLTPNSPIEINEVYSTLFYSFLLYTLLYSTLNYSTLHYYTLLYYTLHYSTLHFSTILYLTVPCPALLDSTFYSTELRVCNIVEFICLSNLYEGCAF